MKPPIPTPKPAKSPGTGKTETPKPAKGYSMPMVDHLRGRTPGNTKC